MQGIRGYLLYRGFPYGKATQLAKKSLSELDITEYTNMKDYKLSGGTKKKVLIATVINSGASILFLDEPTSGLDPIAREEVWKLLLKLKKKHFIFLTTHYLEEAEKLADNIGIIHNGKMLAIGTISDLRKRLNYSTTIKFKGKNSIDIRNVKKTVGIDGYTQLFVNDDEAYRISKKLIAKGLSFSINPVSLESIFYYYVKSGLDDSKEED
jgi:ABC-2 type transport system ATP-binding protein